jgi:predicted nucleic acid-binding protein
MRFWDSSALVPLVVEEERSAACRALRRSDPTLVVWMLSRTEVLSALHRLVRDELLEKKDLPSARRRLERLARTWAEVEAVEPTRERAERALGLHALSAAGALQLGAALLVVKDRPRQRAFVTADKRLAAAATAEGFDVIVPG